MQSYILLDNHIYIYSVKSGLIRPTRDNKVCEISKYYLIYLHRIN